MDRFEITAASPSTKLFSLFHTDKGKRPKQMTAAVYACSDTACGQTLIGNHSVLFSCPSCKSTMNAGRTKDMTASDIAALKKIGNCSMCACDVLTASDAAPKAKSNKLYCIVCSDIVSLKADASDENADTDEKNEDGTVKKPTEENPEMPDMAPDAVANDAGDGLGEDTETNTEDLPEGDDESGNSDDEETDEDEDDSEDDDSEEDDSEDDESMGEDEIAEATADDGDNTENNGEKKDNATGDKPKGENAEKKADKPENTDEKKDDDQSEDGVKKDSENKETGKTDAPKPENDKASSDTKTDKTGNNEGNSEKPDNLVASLLAAVGDKAVDINLTRSPNNKKWYLWADDVPVAISEKGRCAEGIREHFDTDKFAAAYHAGSQDGTTEDLLKDFGFEPVNTEVPVDEAIRQTVESQVFEKSKAYALNAADFNERMTRCLGLASLAMIKGTYNDENPIQKALVASLHRLGHADAERTVSKAFESHSSAMLKTLMLRASDLMEKDDTALTEVAKIVQDQKMPSDRAIKHGLPPAALRTFNDDERMDETRVDEISTPVTASDVSRGDSGYRSLFQNRRA